MLPYNYVKHGIRRLTGFFSLRKYNSARLLFSSCNAMSIKFLLDYRVVLFNGDVVQLCNALMPILGKKCYYLFCKYDIPFNARLLFLTL
jgi:hypothetical protein